MLYGLVNTAAAAVIEYREFDGDPPQLASAKGLRWLPVTDTGSPGAAWGEVAPTVTVAAEKVERVWPTPSLSQAGARRAALIAAVKAEAMRRILDIAPEWKQRKLTARATELALKMLNRETLSADEGAELAAGQVIWSRIKEIRSASDVIEADISACTDLQALAGWDVMAGWPAGGGQ